MSTAKPIKVNLTDVEPVTQERGRGFASTRRTLGAATRARLLGASHMEVPPGRSAWPRHWHAANEEALFVLSGTGTLRVGEITMRVGAGDFVALPPGPEHAHLLTNDGEVALVYLCFSTMNEPDVVGYPDSHKIGVFAGSAPGGAREARTVSCFHRTVNEVGYWDGEAEAEEAD